MNVLAVIIGTPLAVYSGGSHTCLQVNADHLEVLADEDAIRRGEVRGSLAQEGFDAGFGGVMKSESLDTTASVSLLACMETTYSIFLGNDADHSVSELVA